MWKETRKENSSNRTNIKNTFVARPVCFSVFVTATSAVRCVIWGQSFTTIIPRVLGCCVKYLLLVSLIIFKIFVASIPTFLRHLLLPWNSKSNSYLSWNCKVSQFQHLWDLQITAGLFFCSWYCKKVHQCY